MLSGPKATTNFSLVGRSPNIPRTPQYFENPVMEMSHYACCLIQGARLVKGNKVNSTTARTFASFPNSCTSSLARSRCCAALRPVTRMLRTRR